MNIDFHITTCHRDNVKCRVRSPEQGVYGWNITEWTQQERLEISKISVESIIRQVNLLRKNHKIRLSLLDDGSNYPPAIQWLNSLQNIEVVRKPNSGSSDTINKYIDSVSKDTDLIIHFEDDNLLFNPFGIDWIQYSYDILTDPSIGVVTLRSGLPTDPRDKGYSGAWGPQGTHLIHPIFRCMGNAHHIMLYETYKQFLPLHGNTGACEAYMNNKLQSMDKRNIELQEFVYSFHTHKLNGKVESEDINMWNKTGEGYEFGIKDMHEYLTQKGKLDLKKYNPFPENIETLTVINYAY